MRWFGIIVILCASVLTASAQASVPAAVKAARAEFIEACRKGFESGNPEFGQKLCQCAATESGAQGVPLAVLRQETALISADAKHPIQDQRLLAAVQVCAMKTMEASSQND